jgi:type I restriction enzyme S subunit
VPDTLVFNIVFAWEQAVAVLREADAGMIASHRFPMFRPNPKSASLEFLERVFQRKRGKHILELASPGGAGRNKTLNVGDLLDLKIEAPTRTEQEKISAFLGAVDKRLDGLRREKALLADYKAGLMQRIFSRDLRFRADDGSAFPEWREMRLRDIVQFSKGRGISKEDIVEGGATPCIRYGQIYTDYGEVIRAVISSTNSQTNGLLLSQIGDVIIPASGEDPNDMARACAVMLEGVALGGDINVLRGTFDGPFMAYYLSGAKRREIARVAQGNSVVHLYGSHLADLRIELPHPEEQRKIADALGAIDSKIDAVAAQIDQLETFKRGLLQKMFV